jgi:hypothetical protein
VICFTLPIGFFEYLLVGNRASQLEALFALRAIARQVDDVPQVAAMAAAIQTPSGGTDRFDERRKRRIADQILFVPRPLDGKGMLRSNNGRRL